MIPIIAEAVAQNENLDILQVFNTLSSQAAKKQVIMQVIDLCYRQGSLLLKHKWLVTLARLLEEFSATASHADYAAFPVFFQHCTDLRLISKPIGDLSAMTPLDLKSGLCSGLRIQAAGYLREAIVTLCPNPRGNFAASNGAAWSLRNASVRVMAPVRLDLGMGGISDIPPYSLERYGNCINMPVKLNGRFPLEAKAELLTQPAFQFVSKDLGLKRNYRTTLEFNGQPASLLFHQEVVRFLMSQILEVNQSDELFAFLKGGLLLETRSYLPVGTGLGVSSLLLCTLLQAFSGLLQFQLTPQMLFVASVYLENVTGICGGWEDDTAVYPGVKLMESFPATPLSPRIKPLNLNHGFMQKLQENLILVNTGIPKQGLAFFDAMTERYCLRDAQALEAIERNNDLNHNLADLLIEGDLTGIGQIMTSQWENWKILSQGKCTNPAIDCLLDDVVPFVHGARMNGSGQGGCAMFIARDGMKRDLLHAIKTAIGDSAVIYQWEPVL